MSEERRNFLQTSWPSLILKRAVVKLGGVWVLWCMWGVDVWEWEWEWGDKGTWEIGVRNNPRENDSLIQPLMGSTEFYQDLVLFSKSVCGRGWRERWKDILIGKQCFRTKSYILAREVAEKKGVRLEEQTAQFKAGSTEQVPLPAGGEEPRPSLLPPGTPSPNRWFTGETVKMWVSCSSATKRQRRKEARSNMRPQLERSGGGGRRALKWRPGLTSSGHQVPVTWP